MSEQQKTDPLDDPTISACPEDRTKVFEVIPDLMRALVQGNKKEMRAALARVDRESAVVALLDAERRLNLALLQIKRLEAMVGKQ
jgi:hypothetical protein